MGRLLAGLELSRPDRLVCCDGSGDLFQGVEVRVILQRGAPASPVVPMPGKLYVQEWQEEVKPIFSDLGVPSAVMDAPHLVWFGDPSAVMASLAIYLMPADPPQNTLFLQASKHLQFTSASWRQTYLQSFQFLQPHQKLFFSVFCLFLVSRHPNLCEVESHCSFDLNFPR